MEGLNMQQRSDLWQLTIRSSVQDAVGLRAARTATMYHVNQCLAHTKPEAEAPLVQCESFNTTLLALSDNSCRTNLSTSSYPSAQRVGEGTDQTKSNSTASG
jgi:hypothetical protein